MSASTRLKQAGLATIAQLRPLPDVLIIGAMKGGTTSLYWHLVDAGVVAPGRQKEVRWFGPMHEKPLWWYRHHFPIRTRGRLVVDATPSYLRDPEAPGRVKRVLPDVKMIALLRDPVDRAFSHYRHTVSDGRESRSFEDALAGESDLASAPWRDLRARGRYAEQLERWFDLFDRDQFLVLQSERFFADPAETTASVAGWLGRPELTVTSTEPRNVGEAMSSMDPTTRVELVEYFAPHNERLFDLIGERFDWS